MPHPESDSHARDVAPDAATRTWKHIPASETPPPLVARVPYVEVSLVHPDLPETRIGGAFYPSALPYTLDDERRVFYWRNALPPESRKSMVDESASTDPENWRWVCATPDRFIPHQGKTVRGPHPGAQNRLELASQTADGHEVVVDATIAGDSTTAHVAGYSPPAVTVRELTQHAVEIAVDGHATVVPTGDRMEIPTAPQSVRLLEEPASPRGNAPDDAATDTMEATTTPRVVVRYPGRRTVYHPAPGADCLLFPSFGVDLATVPDRLPVNPDSVAIDLDAVADAMGADRSTRPYAERVLWEAFVYAAFDPDRENQVGLTQFENGLLAVHDPPTSMVER